MNEKAHAQTAHLQFTQVDTQPKITKELFHFRHTIEITTFSVQNLIE